MVLIQQMCISLFINSPDHLLLISRAEWDFTWLCLLKYFSLDHCCSVKACNQRSEHHLHFTVTEIHSNDQTDLTHVKLIMYDVSFCGQFLLLAASPYIRLIVNHLYAPSWQNERKVRGGVDRGHLSVLEILGFILHILFFNFQVS